MTTATWGSGPPEIVLLHDGLGSIAQWRSVPADLARRTGRTVLAYDRAGHGASTPVPNGPWPPDWLHREAEVLAELLRETEATSAALVGHSDGGSIAAIHSARQPSGGPIALLAAHSWVEPICVAEIARMRERPDDIIRGLRRFHADADALFEAWSGVWVSDSFAHWDIRADLGSISVPTLVIQGVDDEYATDAHAIETSTAIGPNAEPRLLPGLGHLLPHQAPELVVELVAQFLVTRSP
jgi:pimeloyl-ACP methyl ester carboxylesterase